MPSEKLEARALVWREDVIKGYGGRKHRMCSKQSCWPEPADQGLKALSS